MEITIIAVGKKHDKNLVAAIEEYEKRLKNNKINWTLIKPSKKEEESDFINAKIENYDFVILLDEIGKVITSDDLSHLIQNAQVHSKKLAFIIGGAYGVTATVKNNSNLVISFGKMVFPHQLVRLMLTEQIYRSFEIIKGTKYHHS